MTCSLRKPAAIIAAAMMALAVSSVDARSSSKSYSSHKSYSSYGRSSTSGLKSPRVAKSSYTYKRTSRPNTTYDYKPRQPRSTQAKNDFKKSNPCPSTGSSKGACPGYDIDHRRPLAAGGEDKPSNMQWLSKEQHKQKTSQERRDCTYGCER